MTDKLEVAILSQFIHPEDNATGQLMTALGVGLVQRGAKVTAYAAQPNYFSGAKRTPLRINHEGMRVVRVWSTHFGRRRILGRALDGITFTAAVLFRVLRSVPTGATIVVTTTPPSLPVIGALVKSLKRIRFIFIVHDVYPEIAIKLGAIRPGSMVHAIARVIDRFTLLRADSIIVLGADMYEVVCSKLPRTRHNRVVVIPNWAEDSIKPVAKTETRRAQRSKWLGRFVVQYSGNVGQFQGLEAVVGAAAMVRGSNVLIAIVGEGVALSRFRAMAEQLKVDDHLVFLPRVLPADLNDSLGACDMALVSLAEWATGLSVPSKYYAALASGRGVIALMSAEAEVARSVVANNCGIVVPPASPHKLADTILALSRDPGLVSALGRRARQTYESHHRRDLAVTAYGSVILNRYGGFGDATRTKDIK